MNGVKVFGLLTLSIPLFVIVGRYYYSSSSKNKQQQQEEEEEEQVKVRSWAELEWDLLGEIVSRLFVTDQARFRVVCKNWLAAAHPIINANATKPSLPWQGCNYPGCCSEFQIFDPLSSSPNHLASRHIIDWSQLGIPSPTTICLHLVKYNWLFLTIKKPSLFFWTTRRYVLLFNPLTRRIITLPTFDCPNGFRFASTFSTHPSSQDCVFCMVDNIQNDKIVILTYQNGDKQWTSRQFDVHPEFKPGNLLPHILGGILYIHSPHGQVASYNILNGQFNFDRLLPDDVVVQSSGIMTIRSFVLNGELMIIGFNRYVKNLATLPGQQFVRRYDRLSKVWIPVTTLSDYALFFNYKFADVSLINTKDRTRNGVLPNKIYCFFNGGCLVYSLEDGKLVEFKSINSNLLEHGGDDLPEYKYKYNYATPDTYSSFWLEAPRVRSSSRYAALETREAWHSTCP
ncbi:hypothetical protein POM88_040675 [Heracleum sosnowskyi]|uniref:F-box protein n=1 Tax=Heracleum sosnowskyi TaxID=360622 RepID=A0AAD8HEX6_9APIA|nr:hypothetical protein POM88_040675 [Heracleum sosnowskyi]